MTIARYSLMAAATALALTACQKQDAAQNAASEAAASSPAAGAEVIKIGVAGPLTGPLAHIGKDTEYGVRMAADDINAAGGLELAGKKYKIEIVAEDDQADPKTATAVAQRLVDAKVAGVVGHVTSGATIPASKIYSEAGIPQLTPSSTAIPFTNQGFKTTFRMIANDAAQGKVLGSYAVEKLKVKKVAIIDDRTAYGQGLADEFEKAAKAAGAEVVKREFTSAQETDFSSILTNVKSAKPELVFFGGMDAQGAPLKKQMTKLGVNAQLLGPDGLSTGEFLKLAGNDAEGTITSQPGQPKEQLQGAQDFFTKFKAKFNVDVQLYAPNSYDALMVLVEAMKRAGSADPAKYLPEMAKTDYTGLTGKIAFDEKGDLKDGAITVYQAKGGKWEVLEVVGGKPAAK
ncbi:branched-chain amino acid ABC transporter substrate-binding protein [Chitinilyticum piscinae]|uniref:Branched-chain amino acid ABC transporter substrate-binding protein n=1 Tax=Chitinilyticum piscinae TaxID=2866724 RepID=A0A8J7KBC7_9NEIS|nr:branched-chain amino acid ABC transporter substrate-binding protein [Chitinilyticum piscinae]MBE9610099.1 branched-chain amino acid ABC transporter substrate-binding protein [Chitinilyticum piscinae]